MHLCLILSTGISILDIFVIVLNLLYILYHSVITVVTVGFPCFWRFQRKVETDEELVKALGLDSVMMQLGLKIRASKKQPYRLTFQYTLPETNGKRP